MDERNTSFFRFEDLRVYGKAVDYSKWVISTLHEPRTECECKLAESFTHSALDIALNIAEGSSRHKGQFDNYLKISKTAIRECVIYTSVAHGLGMVDDNECEKSRELLMELTRMVGALIISLQRGGRRNRDASDSLMPGDDGSMDLDLDSDFGGGFDELS